MKHIKADLLNIDSSISVAVVVSRFNEDITRALKKGCLDRLLSLGVSENHITLVEVPGAIEIPLTLKKLANTEAFDALIALGAVVRGETTHYDYVCQMVSEGCQSVMLSSQIPVIFGVLTTENEAQAFDRLGGKHGHKGQDAADCAIEMIQILKHI